MPKEINQEYLTCPIRNVISKFGDKWSLLVLYELNLNGTLRFSQLSRRMSDCSQKMLSSTLKRLEAIQLVNRTIYPEVPPRVEYSLTERARTLMPIMIQLNDWANLNFDAIAGQSH